MLIAELQTTPDISLASSRDLFQDCSPVGGATTTTLVPASGVLGNSTQTSSVTILQR